VAFTQFGTELDKATQAQLARGERMVEILKQEQFAPLSVAQQVMIIYCGTRGFLDDIAVAAIKKFEKDFYAFMDQAHPDIEKAIESEKELSALLANKLDAAITEFKSKFSA